MKTSTLLLIGGATAVGIYFLTKNPRDPRLTPQQELALFNLIKTDLETTHNDSHLTTVVMEFIAKNNITHAYKPTITEQADLIKSIKVMTALISTKEYSNAASLFVAAIQSVRR
jgi:hypothetical protein